MVARRHSDGNTVGMPTPERIAVARDRFHTPEPRARGISGVVEIPYRLGADGRPDAVRAIATHPGLEPVARPTAATLSLGHGRPGTPAEVSPTRVPSRSR